MRAFAVAVFLGGLTAGCAPAPADRPATIAVHAIDEVGFAEALAQHRGEVVLVDFWATWCAPCVDAFPHTVALHKRLAGQGLAVISVSMDEPDSEQAVRAFLVRQGAVFENLLSRYGIGSKSFEAFGVEAIPCFKLFDRSGKLQKSFGGDASAVDLQGIDRAVEEMLAVR